MTGMKDLRTPMSVDITYPVRISEPRIYKIKIDRHIDKPSLLECLRS